MKKLYFFCMMCFMALSVCMLVGCDKDENLENDGNGGSGGGEVVDTIFVDLGLPSGTKWKRVNETNDNHDFYTYDEAMSAFGDALPTKEQFKELILSCTWTWQDDSYGYKVTGNNGNSIFLPAAGTINYEGNPIQYGEQGNYWSSTLSDEIERCSWILTLNPTIYGTTNSYWYGYLSVRLVQD